jgi:intracellular multiplication protein IcmC
MYMKFRLPFRLSTLSVLGLALVSGPVFAGGGDNGNLPDILMDNLGWIANIFQTISILLGLGTFIGGLFQLKRYGETRTMMSSQMSIAGPMMMMLSGAALLYLPTFIATVLVGFWGPGAEIDLPVESNMEGWSQYISPVLMLVRLVGIYAFTRGFVILSRTGNHGQQGQIGKSLIHILAGILCVHIMGTVKLIESLFGFDFSL